MPINEDINKIEPTNTSLNSVTNQNYTENSEKDQNSVVSLFVHQDFKNSGISNATIQSYITNDYLETQDNGWKLYYPELLENKISNYFTFIYLI